MNYFNDDFLNILTQSFDIYLKTNARSNEKLKILHQKIANDLKNKLDLFNSFNTFEIFAYGINEGNEKKIKGRYYDKKVDIAIFKNTKQYAGIAVKFVMSNYAQNSNNYFENMLGETANLRANKISYFQILIVLEMMPYFSKENKIIKIEELKLHHLKKYISLSNDNENLFFHTPNKTLLVIIQLPDFKNIQNKLDYQKMCLGKRLNYSQKFQFNLGSSLILNKYDAFLNKVAHAILAV